MDQVEHPVRVLAADRREIFRCGIIGILRDTWPRLACAQAAGVDALKALMAEEAADLLLLDLGLPGLDGVAGIQQIRSLHPECRIIVLGETLERAAILECLGAGALGYLPREATPAQLVRAIEAVMAGAVFAPASLAGRPAEEPAPGPAREPAPVVSLHGFTGRQADVFRLLAEGCATKTIARRLNLAVGTVKVHLAAIYRQLGVHGRLEALARVHGNGVSAMQMLQEAA